MGFARGIIAKCQFLTCVQLQPERGHVQQSRRRSPAPKLAAKAVAKSALCGPLPPLIILFWPEEVAIGGDEHRAIAIQTGGGESGIQIHSNHHVSDHRLGQLFETRLDLNHIDQPSENSGRVNRSVRCGRGDRFRDEAQSATFALLEDLDRTQGKFRRGRNHAVEGFAEHRTQSRFERGRWP